MRFRPRGHQGVEEGDLTPMIDMTFQLIAFFMLVINFSDIEQLERINLPESELAKPPEVPYEEPLTIHLTKEGGFVFAGREHSELKGLRSALLRETQIIVRFKSDDKTVADVTIIIRADEDSRIGQVQEIIKTCQELEFEKFALRGKYSDIKTIGGG